MPKDKDLVKIKKESSSHNISMHSDGAYYPYGTSISVEDDMLDELDLNNLSVGDVVEVKGFAFVDSKDERKSKKSSRKEIRLQFTSIKIHLEEDDAVIQMYGE